MTQDQQPVARTSHTEITLDQLGSLQPGLARLMAEVSDRYWILYYAAKAGNWKLAALQSSEVEKALRMGEITRPNTRAHLEAFIKGPLTAMNRAIEDRDWAAFEHGYNIGVTAANAYHRDWTTRR